MYKEKFLSTLQQKLVYESVTPSHLGFKYAISEMHIIHNLIMSLDLSKFSTKNSDEFKQSLDESTSELVNTLSAEERTWGTARTAINFYLREALYNRYLSEVNDLFLSEHFFETPINDTSVLTLRRQKNGSTLPEWSGLSLFTPEQSDTYQNFAADLAKDLGVSRVHLELFLWPGWKS
ncbi:MAG: hypothetical protein WD267_00325 [Balneolales bacterium]